MLNKIIKTANDASNTKELTFEIGSNSDLILEKLSIFFLILPINLA